jgi:hypothetical protein
MRSVPTTRKLYLFKSKMYKTRITWSVIQDDNIPNDSVDTMASDFIDEKLMLY